MDPARETIREIAAKVVSGQLAPVEGAQQIAAQAAALRNMPFGPAAASQAASGESSTGSRRAGTCLC